MSTVNHGLRSPAGASFRLTWQSTRGAFRRETRQFTSHEEAREYGRQQTRLGEHFVSAYDIEAARATREVA